MIELLTLTNPEEFDNVTQQELSLIVFGTAWSSPCQNQSTILVNFIRRYHGMIVIARIDVEKHPGITQKCNIQTVPTLIVYRQKREMKRLVGLQSIENLHALVQAMKRPDVKSFHPETALFPNSSLFK